MRVSVIIPAHNEEAFLGRCIDSIRSAALHAGAQTEIIVVANRCTDGTAALARSLGASVIDDESSTIAAVRNRGIDRATEDIIVTIDADSWMSVSALNQAIVKLKSGDYIGGGAFIRPERLSLGILLTLLVILPVIVCSRVSVGMFWFRRSAYMAIGGFDESLVSAEDLAFGRRLRKLGQNQNLRYGTIRSPGIYTSCRKFDHFGDWYLIKNPFIILRLLFGRNRRAADSFYYNLR